MRLRLVSWNIHSCNGTDRKHDPARIAHALRTLDADIIGLQEVDWREGLHNGREQHQAIAAELRMHAIAGPNLRDDKGEFGNALITRLPVESVHRLDLSTPGVEPRGAIDAVLRHHEGTVRAVVTHLGLNRKERNAQLNRLAKHLKQPHPEDQLNAHRPKPHTTPRCLMGDLNEWRPTRRALAPLMPELFDAAVAPRTFPTRWPLFPLDRILAGPAPVLTRRINPEDKRFRVASDHLPVVIDAEWPTPAENSPPHDLT